MRKGEAAGRSVIRLAYLSAAVAVLVVVVLAGIYEERNREAFRQSARAAVQSELGVLRSGMQGVLEADIQVAQALAGVVRYQPDIDQARFSELGAELLKGESAIRNIGAAPGLVVSMTHPLEENAAALGLDYRATPEQYEAAVRARDLDTTVLAGPVDLIQGGRGFIVRAPVFHGGEGAERRFWGIVSAVIDEDALYRTGGLSDPGLGLDVVLTGRDGKAGDGEAFFGDPAILGQDPVTAEVALPSGAWQIAAVPKGGWLPPPELWVPRALFVMAGLLIVTPIFGAAQMVAARQSKLAFIRDREAEMSRLSWRLEFALAASEVGVWDVDLETGVLLWDERTKALFGFTGQPGPFSEVDWAGALHPDDRERAITEANAAVTGNGRFVTDYRIVLPDGTIRHVRDMAARYQGQDGQRRLVGLVWDVTPDVERQEELNLRRLEAEEATVAKSRFLAAMSHEIRTPMSGVLGLLGLMLDDPLPERQRERAKIALASAQSLLQILNDILDFSKLEAHQIRVCEENVDARALIEDVMELMSAPAEQKGLSLSVEVDAGVPERIYVDPMRLRQVLTNLLSNATKFTLVGEVCMRVGYAPEGEEGRLEVEVEDTGIGIGEAHIERIFEDFVQADNSLTRRAGGTGLGLAISRQLVGLMGGTLGVRSVPGMGSTFSFSIRTRAAPQVAPDPEAMERWTSRREHASLRVLLAEDHATNQYLIGAYLGSAGHEMVVVQDGREAVEAAKAGGFDVILMDVQMPEIDGLEATRQIRALPGPEGEVPIIALTANAMPGDREACIEAGMDGYLSKPIDVVALQKALQRYRPDRSDWRQTIVKLG